jgi:hypothetical protein
MSTAVINTLSSDISPHFQVVNLEILVQNVDFVGLFDRIEVWRSRSGASGPFEEVTATQWLCARLPKLAGDPPAVPVVGASVNIVGDVLEFYIKEKTKVSVTFTGTDPLTLSQCSAQIAAQSQGLLSSYVAGDGTLVVQTREPGTAAILRSVTSNAAVILALPTQFPDSLATGRDARIQLTKDVGSYAFADQSGSSHAYYRTRFRNSGSGTTSEFSLPFNVGQAMGVSQANLVTGYLDLVTVDGRPLAYIEVSVHSTFKGDTVEGKLLAGGDVLRSTDATGHVEFILVRGQKYTVGISGTNLVKEVTAPTDAGISSFVLIDPTYGDQDDYFKVRVPDLPTLERRSI